MGPEVKANAQNLSRTQRPASHGGSPRLAPWAAGGALGFLGWASVCLTGCVSSLATGALADAMAGSGSTYATDDDPELVREAVPFALKTMEAVLQKTPDHQGLLIALASGFTQYGFAFVAEDAHRLSEDDIDAALRLERRAQRLYLRARGYALRGLELRHPQFLERLQEDEPGTLAALTQEDVALLYWMTASWALAIGTAKNDPELLADYPLLFPMARRALALNESWGDGAVHDLLLSLEASFPGGSPKRARAHFERAVELAQGTKAGSFVSLAERVCVKEQNAKEFHDLLGRALAIDPDAHPESRLENIVMQRRAARLQAMSEDLFLEDVAPLERPTDDMQRKRL